MKLKTFILILCITLMVGFFGIIYNLPPWSDLPQLRTYLIGDFLTKGSLKCEDLRKREGIMQADIRCTWFLEADNGCKYYLSELKRDEDIYQSQINVLFINKRISVSGTLRKDEIYNTCGTIDITSVRPL